MSYCPKCKSKLYPLDDKPMKEHGMCSYCVTFTNKPKGLRETNNDIRFY